MRRVLRTPVASSAAILSLALGIGATTATFTLLNAIVLAELPIRGPQELVHIGRVNPAAPEQENAFSFVALNHFREELKTATGVFGWLGGGIANIDAGGHSFIGSATEVTFDYFRTLGLQPAAGRFFGASDSSAVAVISYKCWQERYGSNAAVIGQVLRVEGVPLTIVGVAPNHFGGLVIDVAEDVIVPFGFRDAAKLRDAGQLGVEIYARMAPGKSINQIQAELDAVWPAVRRESLPPSFSPEQQKQFNAQRAIVRHAGSGSSFLRQTYSRPLQILLAMSVSLLLISCLNLANLMLARVASLKPELAIRSAVGATSWQIVRPALYECLLLIVSGMVSGVAFASIVAPQMLSWMWSGYIPLTLRATVDVRVLCFATGCSVLTALGFFVAPALRIGRPTDSTRGVHAGLPFARWLLPIQFAVSLALLVVALLLGTTLKQLHRRDLGFRTDGLVIAQLYPATGAESQGFSGRTHYYRRLVEQVGRLPGVLAASYSHMGPVLRYESRSPAKVSGLPSLSASAVFELVSPGFFDIVGVRVLAGRDFSWADDDGKPPVVVISASLARKLFPGGGAVGQFIDFGDKRNLQVIGVVSNASLWKPESEEPRAVYRAFLQEPEYNAPRLDLRTQGWSAQLGAQAKRVVESFGEHTVLRVQTHAERTRALFAAQQMSAWLASFFAAAALLLAAVGLYGVLSQVVSSRSNEIAVRMAVGAREHDISVWMGRQVFWIVTIGVMIAVPLIWAASRVTAGVLYRVSYFDPVVLFVALSVLIGAASAAAVLPTRRAVKTNPAELLH